MQQAAQVRHPVVQGVDGSAAGDAGTANAHPVVVVVQLHPHIHLGDAPECGRDQLEIQAERPVVILVNGRAQVPAVVAEAGNRRRVDARAQLAVDQHGCVVVRDERVALWCVAGHGFGHW